MFVRYSKSRKTRDGERVTFGYGKYFGGRRRKMGFWGGLLMVAFYMTFGLFILTGWAFYQIFRAIYKAVKGSARIGSKIADAGGEYYATGDAANLSHPPNGNGLPPQKPVYKNWWFWVAAPVCALFWLSIIAAVLGNVSDGGSNNDGGGGLAVSAAATTEEPTATVKPTRTPKPTATAKPTKTPKPTATAHPTETATEEPAPEAVMAAAIDAVDTPAPTETATEEPPAAVVTVEPSPMAAATQETTSAPTLAPTVEPVTATPEPLKYSADEYKPIEYGKYVDLEPPPSGLTIGVDIVYWGQSGDKIHTNVKCRSFKHPVIWGTLAEAARGFLYLFGFVGGRVRPYAAQLFGGEFVHLPADD